MASACVRVWREKKGVKSGQWCEAGSEVWQAVAVAEVQWCV